MGDAIQAPRLVGPDVTMVYTPAQWLSPNLGTLQSRIVRLAIASVLTMEDPPGSNRGPEVEPLLRWAGVPQDLIARGAGYWCCAWATRVWADAGAEVMKTASCANLLAWGQATGRFSRHVASEGAFVLYAHDKAQPTHANHVGIIARVRPLVASIEGNTTVEGRGDERNGTAVAAKLVTERSPANPAGDPVLGYVHVYPQP
jgi:hypothetical protein